MKKINNRQNGIHCRKWRVTWTVLILVFSLFSASAIASGHDTDSNVSTGMNLEPKIEAAVIDTVESQENVEDLENKQGSSDKIGNQISMKENTETENEIDQNINSKVGIESVDSEQQSSDEIDNQKNTKENTETRSVIKKNTENQKNVENFQENKKTNSQETINKNLKSKKVSNDEIDNKKSTKDNLKTKTGTVYRIKSQNGVKKNLVNKKVSNFGIDNKKNSKDTLGTKTGISYSVQSQENKEVKSEINSGVSNWNKMKLILALHPYSIRPFYTTQEKVELRYKGPASLGNQKVNVYLVRERNLSFSENAFSIASNNQISFGDVINKDTESYVQIPKTLNENGELPASLLFGPLPAGSYWILISPAENETKTPISEKKIISADYFEVLKYDMEIKTPDALKEGENFEVNMTLKNSSVQENYTYWALMIREDAYNASINRSKNGTKTGIGTFLKGFSIIENSSLNSMNYDSGFRKEELKNEIEILIGAGNGTINIGEENQSNLSIESSNLPPGKYLIFAGAYGRDKGFAGIAQKELIIERPKQSIHV